MHRDIKPDNLLIAAPLDDPQQLTAEAIKVNDFGISVPFTPGQVRARHRCLLAVRGDCPCCQCCDSTNASGWPCANFLALHTPAALVTSCVSCFGSPPPQCPIIKHCCCWFPGRS